MSAKDGSLLTRLLIVKFRDPPAEVQARLMDASAAELDAMAERVLTAATLAEVLG